MRQITLNRQSITSQPGLTSYILDITVTSATDMPEEVFVMQRLKKYDGTISDTFVAVCTPAQLEDLEVNTPMEGSTFFRTKHIQLVSSALQYLQWAYAEILRDVQLLCADLDALDSFDVSTSTTVTAIGSTTN